MDMTVEIDRPFAGLGRCPRRQDEVAVSGVEGAESLPRPGDGAEALDAPHLEAAVRFSGALHLGRPALRGPTQRS